MSEEQSVDLTFREAITELGQIVEALESNKLELEESLVKYQQRVDVLKGELGVPVNDDVVDTTLQKA